MTKPMFKWSGGKGRLFKRYTELGFFPDPSQFDTFVDLFFGAGAVTCWVRSSTLARADSLPVSAATAAKCVNSCSCFRSTCRAENILLIWMSPRVSDVDTSRTERQGASACDFASEQALQPTPSGVR